MYNYEYIKETRISKGMTIVSLADSLGMDCGNYYRLENGKYKSIPGRVVPKLCVSLGLDIYKLLNMAPVEAVKQI